MPIIKIPEAGWAGAGKKIELRQESVIRDVFELAALLETDFTQAVYRVLKTCTRLVIEEEKALKARLAQTVIRHPQPQPQPQPQVIQSQPAQVFQQQSTARSRSSSSGADLI